MNCETDILKLRIDNIIDKYTILILSNPNIVGVGQGIKIVKNYSTNIPCLTFIVKKKLHKNLLSPSTIIPQNFYGCITDVVEIGEAHQEQSKNFITPPTPLTPFTRIRPATSGTRIGTGRNELGGTLGYLVTGKPRKNETDKNKSISENTEHVYILSCGDVLFDNPQWEDKNAIYQPPPQKDKSPIASDLIATSVQNYKIEISNNEKKQLTTNKINGGLAYVGPEQYYVPLDPLHPLHYSIKQKLFYHPFFKDIVIPELPNKNVVVGEKKINVNDEILTYGGGSGAQIGKVIAIHTNVSLSPYKIKIPIKFSDQIIVQINYHAADCGSLGLYLYPNTPNDPKKYVFGMCIGFLGGNLAIYSNISTILSLLDVKLRTWETTLPTPD